jgi:hypothetical protein
MGLRHVIVTAALVVLSLALWSAARADRSGPSNAFTYQGRLLQGASAFSGAADLGFALFDAATGGRQIGDDFLADNVSINDGIFTVALDFGPGAFDGQPRWLQIAVNGVVLTPRQAITAAPFALYASAAGGGVGSGGGGVIAADSVAGAGFPLTSALAFVTDPVTVTISAGDRIHVTASRALGASSAGGATNLELGVGYRNVAGGSVQAFEAVSSGLSSAANIRSLFAVTGVISDLPAGTYEVGMVGRITPGAVGSWNNNSNGSVSVLVVRP